MHSTAIKDFVAQEMKRQPITDYLRHHSHLTDQQYRHVIDIKLDLEANKYLLELVTSQPKTYLKGLKEALQQVKQEDLIDYLPA